MGQAAQPADDHTSAYMAVEQASPAALQAVADRVGPTPRLPTVARSRYRARALATMLCGAAWLTFSLIASQHWLRDMQDAVGVFWGTLIVAGIAWIPGYLYAQLLASVLLDRRPPLALTDALPPVTVIVAVYNEEEGLPATVAALAASEYPGELTIVVADDGSSDRTLEVACSLTEQYDNLRVFEVPHGGKHSALNAALMHVTSPLVVTVDADTIVHREALRRIVTRLVGTDNSVAVAGALLVGNDDDTLITRMQGWEYRLSLAAIKRQQALFGGTLVAQGAFSVYGTREVLRVGGWPDAIGEDILVTWRLLSTGGQVDFEPTAFAYTDAPLSLRALYRQRRRWARGMIEGLKSHGSEMVRSRRLVAHGVIINYGLPLLDATYLLAFIPGLVLAIFFGNYIIVGPLTVLVMPMALLLFWVMARSGRAVRAEAGIELQRHWSGFVAYMTFYRTLIAAASIAGYIREFRGRTRDW